jgi:hypothetical protein
MVRLSSSGRRPVGYVVPNDRVVRINPNNNVFICAQCFDINDISDVRPGKMGAVIDGSRNMLVCWHHIQETATLSS